MSTYRIDAIDGKIVYEGDGPLYFNNSSITLEKIYKAAEVESRICFYNVFNIQRNEYYMAFPIEIKTVKPLSIGFYTMKKINL